MPSQNRVARSQFAAFASLLVLLALSGCTARQRSTPIPTPWPTPMVAEQITYRVERGTIVDSIKLSGQVVPAVWETLHFPVDGQLAVLKAAEGAQVEKGDILAELEMQALNDQLAQAQVSLAQAQDQLAQQQRARRYALERARLNLRVQELTLERIRQSAELSRPLQAAEAEKELERARLALQRAQSAYDVVSWKPGAAASPQALALQAATFDYEIAEARYKLQTAGDQETQLALQENQVKLARLAVQELEEGTDGNLQRNLAKAEMLVKNLERQIEERRLRAPFAGQVVAVGVDLEWPEEQARTPPKPGEAIPAYAGMVVVARPDAVEIVIESSPADRSSELVVGQLVTVTHTLAPGQPASARVVQMPVRNLGAAAVAQPSPIRLSLLPGAPPPPIGTTVQVEALAAIRADTFLLPKVAVRRSSGHPFVIVRSGSRQRRVDVNLGLESETHIEILSGLNEDDEVIAP